MTLSSNAVTEVAFQVSNDATDATTVKTDQTSATVKPLRDVVQENSAATPANVSAKAESVIVTLTAETEATRTVAVSLHKSSFNVLVEK